jgi:hypothetical protein
VVWGEKLRFINEFFQNQYQILSFRVNLQVIFDELDGFKTVVLFVLEGNVNAFEIKVGVAGGLNDGNGGLFQVIDFHNEIFHFFEFVADALEDFVNFLLLLLLSFAFSQMEEFW